MFSDNVFLLFLKPKESHDGWVDYYNFIRPHESLDWKTPAEYAGIKSPLTNWKDIILDSPKEPDIIIVKSNRSAFVGTPSRYALKRKVRKPKVKKVTGYDKEIIVSRKK
jgi:hypothetical protein